MNHRIGDHSDLPTLGRRAARRRAFTLIELLTVMAVIGILVAITLVVGQRVLGGQREKQTENILIALDRALDEYMTVVGSIPRYDPDAYNDVPGDSNGVQTYSGAGDHCARPDAAVFLRQVQGFGEVDSIITGIGERYLRLTLNSTNVTSTADPNNVEGDPTPSVVDAWAASGWPGSDSTTSASTREYDITKQQVIYYVHPDNALAQDLYGQCLNGRPYFMSAGPDKLYGLRNEPPYAESPVTVEKAEGFVADNVYSYRPGPIKRGMPNPARAWNPN